MKEQSKALTEQPKRTRRTWIQQAQDQDKLALGNGTPGSKTLKRRMWELYCRYRARAWPTVDCYRKACQSSYQGRRKTYTEKNAYQMAQTLEHRRDIAERIQYLINDEVEIIRDKRRAIEERLWSQHEADIGDYFEQTANGTEQPKRLADMSPDIRKNIEKVIIDAKGRVFPQLYNKQLASKELRAMLAIGRQADAGPNLSDAELVSQLAEQAKQLGVEIDLNFRFAQQQPTSAHDTETDASNAQVIDNTEDSKS